jgi:uncharacterized membrane protein/YHS domain-containing protein
MLSYFVHFMRAFLPLALMSGMLIALWTSLRGEKEIARLLGALGAGLLIGALVYTVALKQETLTASRAALYAAGVAATLLGALPLLQLKRRSPWLLSAAWWGALCYLVALGAAACFAFLVAAGEEALSTTTVLNSELILNLGGILCALVTCAALTTLTTLTMQLAARSSRRLLTSCMLLAAALSALPWCSEVLLALMRLELVELTSLRLSLVAKVGKYAYLAAYGDLLILIALALFLWRTRKVPDAGELAALDTAPRRKAKSLVQREARWMKGTLIASAAVLCVLSFFDLYASRPPRISTPIRMLPDAAGLIRIPIAQVADGKLHRYSYLTDDGHLVRFFLINARSGDPGGRPKIGVVFDACMLCGDMGYLQNKNEIVCIACNVRIFIPSIGKEGGCNPIPLKHEVTDDSIVISARELDKGARYFSEVISIKVKDPVSGAQLINLKAPFREEFRGRIYFFENEKTLEKFRASPEKFAGAEPARNFRVQGYRQA